MWDKLKSKMSRRRSLRRMKTRLQFRLKIWIHRRSLKREESQVRVSVFKKLRVILDLLSLMKTTLKFRYGFLQTEILTKEYMYSTMISSLNLLLVSLKKTLLTKRINMVLKFSIKDDLVLRFLCHHFLPLILNSAIICLTLLTSNKAAWKFQCIFFQIAKLDLPVILRYQIYYFYQVLSLFLWLHKHTSLTVSYSNFIEIGFFRTRQCFKNVYLT
jgi:hypothetical protein